MATAVDDHDEHRIQWTDPNLTEPKLQDDMLRRLAESNRRRRQQRPRAARGGWKQEAAEPQQEQEMAQIRYFKYIPYRDMSEPDRRRYLSLGPARLTSSRTEPPPARQRPTTTSAAFWQSASTAKSLKVYDYHLAELSLAYRSPPALLGRPRRLATPPQPPTSQQQQQRSSLFYQMHSRRPVPATAPSVTQQHLVAAAAARPHEEKTTQVSRGCTPLIDSAMSDHYPTEPGDVLSKSASNRLLNVVSVDECHVRHRRRRRRLRRVGAGRAAEQAEVVNDDNHDDEGDADADEAEEEDEEVEHGYWGEEEALEGVEGVLEDADSSQAPPEPATSLLPLSPSDAPPAAPTPTSTRPATERIRRPKRPTEQEMRRLAAAKFLRRNEILREKMSIYLDWKLNHERLGLTDLRVGGAAARFERFTVELVQQEAVVANQYRGGAAGTVPEAILSPRTSHRLRPQQQSETGQRQELSLTEMFDALNA